MTTAAGLVVGSPAYMSPEQASGEPEIDGRTDIYSLASVLYEMLTGQPPFTGPSAQSIIAQRMTGAPQPLRSRRSEVPAALDAAVAKALERAPGDRYRTAGEFHGALSTCLLASTTGERRRWWPFAKSSPHDREAPNA